MKGSNTASASQRFAKYMLAGCLVPSVSTSPANLCSVIGGGLVRLAIGMRYVIWSWYFLLSVNKASGPVRDLVRRAIREAATLEGMLVLWFTCGGTLFLWVTLESDSSEKFN